MSDLSKQGTHRGRNKDNTTQVIFCKYLATSVIFSISEVQGLAPDCIVAKLSVNLKTHGSGSIWGQLLNFIKINQSSKQPWLNVSV